MLRKSIALICLTLLIGAGCAKKALYMSPPPMPEQVQTKAFALSAAASQRYLAVRHKLVVITPESEITKSWESVIAFCGTIQCELISSNIVSQTHDSAPSGSMSLRVKPEDLNKLLAYVGKQGKIAQHTTETEDKTAIVVDTDAKIKNLTDFRDTLRKMLGRPSVGVRDLVEIQEKLAEVQAQLDSQATQRKILANETEKVAIEIDFRAEKTIGSASVFTPIGDALRESTSVLAESVASLITVVVAAIPWLIVIVPACWLFARLWRRVRRKLAKMPG
jgi:Mor family transcriptional regulator